MDRHLSEDELVERIQANAAAGEKAFLANSVLEEAFNASGVKWLDSQVRWFAARGAVTSENGRALASVWGAFLGECIARSCGGRWVIVNGRAAMVAIDGGAAPDVDDAVALRTTVVETDMTHPPNEAFLEVATEVGERGLVPIAGGADVIRQGGRMLVNPWAKVADALDGDAGASITQLYWFAANRTPPDPEERVRAILKNLPFVERWCAADTGEAPAFDVTTVEWIERRARAFVATPSNAQERREELVVLGVALGECLRRSLGGAWIDYDDQAQIYVEACDLTLNPWRRVDLILRGARDESVVAFYRWAEQEVRGDSGGTDAASIKLVTAR